MGIPGIMKRIGAHVSIAGGIANAPLRAQAIGANAFALFTRNQRRWEAPPLSTEQAALFRAACQELGFPPTSLLAHASYLINLASPDPEGWARSRQALIDELQRCRALGIPHLNVHPGSGKGLLSEEESIGRIASSINRVLDETEGAGLVLENTAGQGSSVGHRFEHLAAILDHVSQTSRIGICLDTCHAFAAGYDLRTPEHCHQTFETLQHLVGLDVLRGMHLNDSQTALGSRVDRHQSLGKGHIGWEAFRWIMSDKRFDGIPLILETTDETLWADEIARLRTFEKA